MFGNDKELRELKELLNNTIDGLKGEKSILERKCEKLEDKCAELEKKNEVYETDKELALATQKAEYESKLTNCKLTSEKTITDLENRLSRVKSEVELEYGKEITKHQNTIAQVNSDIVAAKEELSALRSKTMAESSEALQKMQLDYEKLSLKYQHDIKAKEKEIDSLNATIKDKDGFFNQYREATTEFTKQLQNQIIESKEERKELLKAYGKHSK
ncbi:hypothetical protein [Cognatishimia sp.]|uniref:hypothetical protein n=1 Tax=Cognatishimia sp. TaxID=2211648 RepID=UPI0035180335|nr:hypothetical protein [Cognatishimia sp.]NQY58537.1 hypothetical protein [Cognatishimia sp.]